MNINSLPLLKIIFIFRIVPSPCILQSTGPLPALVINSMAVNVFHNDEFLFYSPAARLRQSSCSLLNAPIFILLFECSHFHFNPTLIFTLFRLVASFAVHYYESSALKFLKTQCLKMLWFNGKATSSHASMIGRYSDHKHEAKDTLGCMEHSLVLIKFTPSQCYRCLFLAPDSISDCILKLCFVCVVHRHAYSNIFIMASFAIIDFLKPRFGAPLFLLG